MHAATNQTALLARSPQPTALAARLAGPAEGVTRFESVEELLGDPRLAGVSVLVVCCRSLPLGTLLDALGRMNLEYPALQKVAVVEGPIPLRVASYLTALGVELIGAEHPDSGLDRIAAAVDRMRERRGWVAAVRPAPTGASRRKEAHHERA